MWKRGAVPARRVPPHCWPAEAVPAFTPSFGVVTAIEAVGGSGEVSAIFNLDRGRA